VREAIRCGSLVVGVLLASAGTAHPGAGAAAASLEVGRLSLRRCPPAEWCGTLPRPLDPRGNVPGSLLAYFEYYPHRSPGPAAGTLVAAEGGPGYPTTGSREEFLALFGPLRAAYDVLLMDNRGTGRSGAVDCAELQQAPALTEGAIGRCGRSLGRAAPLYSSALAADDLAALLEALQIRRINLYGDSYGTYFAQVFALRHPDKLRSLVLDGAYPLEGPDYAWYPHYAPAMRDKFNLACERAPACKALAGSSLEHIGPALASLRARPFPARARDGQGRSFQFRADASALAIVMFGGAPAYATLRETDAAARAFADGDRAPLLRLMSEALADTDSRDPSHAPEKFSAGLAAAVFCQDPPQIFDMSLAPERRMRLRDQLMAQRKAQAPDTYAPFSIDEYRGMPLDYAFIDECVQWPVKAERSPAVPLVPPGAAYPDVPVLVLSGELDNMTSVADGAAAAARFAHARHVVIANGFHVNALPHSRSACGAQLARRFLAGLSTGDEGCAAAVPPVRLVPQFARRSRELPPARALGGNRADDEALRAVSAMLLACEDAIARARDQGSGTQAGLRGGTFAIAAGARSASGPSAAYRVDLSGVRWTEDLAISGRIDWPGRSGAVHARLRLEGAPGVSGALEASWPEGVARSSATVRGRLGGRTVVAAAPAP
jgi:pimeloyl-ACP methyl ester carboxylesterase